MTKTDGEGKVEDRVCQRDRSEIFSRVETRTVEEREFTEDREKSGDCHKDM